MQTKFTNGSIGHAWYHNTSTHGKGSNIFFEGATIYSYGYHFPIATRHADCVLFTTDTSSKTTTQHICQVRRAIPSTASVFDVVDVLARTKDAHKYNYDDMQERIHTLLHKIPRARSNKENLLNEVIALNDQANAYTKCFALGNRAKQIPVCIDDVREVIEQDKKDRAVREAKAQARLVKENAAKISQWRGGNISTSELPYLSAVMLRVIGDNVETSHHASFPVDHARKAWRLISRCARTATAFNPNGKTVHLGHYKIDFIEPSGNVQAGCHYIEYAEIERCAQALGLIESETA